MQATMVPLDEGHPFRVEKRVTVVGRKKFVCDMYLPDRRVSQLHCVIRHTDDGDLVIRDLGSTNGTRINGKKVTEGLLVPGDELTFAALKFRLENREFDDQNNTHNVQPKLAKTIPNSKPPAGKPAKQETPDNASQKKISSEPTSPKIHERRVAIPDDALESSQQKQESPRRVENILDAKKSDEHAAVKSIRAESQSDYEQFFIDDQLEGETEEGHTEIIKAANVSREVIEDWPQFPGQFTMVDTSPFDCPNCQGVKMVRAPTAWWQFPLRLFGFGFYCCPRCFRRYIR